MRLVPDRRLPDGSYLSTIYPSERDRRHRTGGLTVRAIDYRLEGVGGAEPFYPAPHHDPRPRRGAGA